MISPLGFWAAHLEILVLCGVLAGAFGFQFLNQEMPCPLCILQRIFMMLAALGAAWILVSLREGTLDRSDYALGHGMIILSGLCGSFVSIRQILLHIVPPDPGYGGTQLGLHLYTWALIVFVCLIGSSGICLLFSDFFLAGHTVPTPFFWTKGILALLGVMILANAITIFFEMGFQFKLPDNPTRYELFHEFEKRD